MDNAAPLPSRSRTVAVVGSGQLLAWASSYYLPAILAAPMARDLGIQANWVYGAFSAALILAALLGPTVGGMLDRRGARQVLRISNFVFAAGLLMLACAPNAAVMIAAWLVIGVAMPMGLYDAAFSLLVSIYRTDARRAIVGVTLIAGFASSLSWPLSAVIEAHWGWRAVCGFWVFMHLTVGVLIHWCMAPSGAPVKLHADQARAPERQGPPRATLVLLGAIFGASGFLFAALAAHLPRILQAFGCSPAAAVAAASLVGAAHVAGRMLEVGYLHRMHPLMSARISLSLHPLGAGLLALIGAPAAVLFTILHGMGVGLMTIVKGTLPLALFGAEGFGKRAATLEAPSRFAQALAPLLFGLAFDAWGREVLWLSAGIALAGLAGVVALRKSEAA